MVAVVEINSQPIVSKEKTGNIKYLWLFLIIAFTITFFINLFSLAFHKDYEEIKNADYIIKIVIALLETAKIYLIPIITIFVAKYITGKIAEETNKLSTNVSDKNARKNMDLINQNRIDSESGWRKNLMDIASKEIIDKSDIYRIRASLRYKEKNNKRENQEKLRVYTRYLLKTHWEHYINLTKSEYNKKESLKDVAKDTIKMIKDIDRKYRRS